MYQPRDFIETHERLVFAVVAAEPEQQRVLATLRYIPSSSGTGHQKMDSHAANHFLETTHPDYLFYSKRCDVNLHGVPIESICKHYQPRAKLAELLSSNPAQTHQQKPLEQKVIDLMDIMLTHGIDSQQVGITGSILLGVQNQNSDIDLVIYDRETFFNILDIVKQSIEKDGQLQALDESLWQNAWQRRDCSLSFAEFLWHEQRKCNKAAIQGTKFDLSLMTPSLPEDRQTYQKCGLIQLQAQVIEDQFRFDYPARYQLDHPQVKEVVCFTQTYAGQARKGERVELSGQLETSANGQQRLLIGTSREAKNETIKVIR